MEATLLAFLYGLHPTLAVVLALLGTLVVVAQAYVALTPTESDNAWYAKLESTPIVGGFVKALITFAPVQRKG